MADSTTNKITTASAESTTTSFDDKIKNVLASASASASGMDNVYLSRTRLYICGVLMPVMDVTITSGMDTYPTALFTLTPDSRLLEIGRHDKIPVHIFQLETYVESPKYVLVFYGYIVSRAYQNTAVNRGISFQAVSYYSILSEARVKFLNDFNEYARVAAIEGEVEDKYVVQTNPSLSDEDYVLLYGITSSEGSTSEHNLVSYPYQYLDNILVWLTSGYNEREQTEKTFKYNSSLTEIYGKYLQEYTAGTKGYAKVPYFDDQQVLEDSGETYYVHESGEEPKNSSVFPILRGVQTGAQAAILGVNRSTAKQDQSVRDIIDTLSDNFEYELACFASPAYNETDGILNDLCFKPLLADSIPPLCNVVFRSQVLSITQEEVFNTQATRVRFRDVSSSKAIIANGNDILSENILGEHALVRLYPGKLTTFDMEDVSSIISDKSSRSGDLANAYSQITVAQEQYSGVHIFDSNSPAWWNWLAVSEDDAASQIVDGHNKLGEFLAQRLLMQSVFVQRTINVTTTYNPYITPGFPGVVFDAHNTQLAFAGYVTAVEHNIGKEEATTAFTMTYVRPLTHAMLFAIRHPIQSMEKLLHNEEAMTNVYNAILGSTNENVSQIPGALAMSFYRIYQQFVSDTTDSTSPQNNPFRAYALQRRNIITFEDFLKFMKMTVGVTGSGQDGSYTPLVIATDDNERTANESKIFKDRWPLLVLSSTATLDAKTESSGSDEKTADDANSETALLSEKTVAEQLLASKMTDFQNTINDAAALTASMGSSGTATATQKATLELLKDTAQNLGKEISAAQSSLDSINKQLQSDQTVADTLHEKVDTETASGVTGANSSSVTVNTIATASIKNISVSKDAMDVASTVSQLNEIIEEVNDVTVSSATGIKQVKPSALLRAVARQEFARVVYA